MNKSPLNLLICNDDGIFAKGIRVLANTLAQAGHHVTVVCPDQERSATGHGLTLHQPIRAKIVEGIFDEKVKAYACSGTPSDCVKLALSVDEVLEKRPDYVLSGINHGPNLGTDVLYSGTVSAAMEGTIEGINSIAISLANYTATEFQSSANFIVKFLDLLSQQTPSRVTLFNINIPALPSEEIKGVLITRQGLRRYHEQFQHRLDPRGKSYYWLAGEVIEDIEQLPHPHLPENTLTDVQAIQDKYITIMPLQYDLTDVQMINELNQWQINH
jgi:5'-nucleotidase